MRSRTAKRGRAAEPASPLTLHIGHLNHVSRRDAAARVMGLIRRQITTPEATYYYLLKTPSGYAYEIQEGGARRAYLPGLMKRLRDAPEAPVHLRAGNRVVRVQGGADAIVSVELPEDEQPEVDALRPSAHMTPFEATGSRALFTAATFFATGAVALVTVALLTTLATQHWERGARAAVATSVKNLPIQHWPHTPSPGSYVSRVQYTGGHWKTIETEARPSSPAPLPRIDLRTPSTPDSEN